MKNAKLIALGCALLFCSAASAQLPRNASFTTDGNRRDNSPNTAGEITPAGPDRGKISCMDR
jgi:hypothetical protein